MKKLLLLIVVVAVGAELFLMVYQQSMEEKKVVVEDKVEVVEDKVVSFEDKVEALKGRIDSAVMRTFVDEGTGAYVLYPDFFEADTMDEATGRFTYEDDATGSFWKLVMFVEPNVDGWDIQEAVDTLCDSNTTLVEQGDDFYLLSGRMKRHRNTYFLEKCFLINNLWYNCTIYYDVRCERAAERLIEMVRKWRGRGFKSEK